MYYYGLGVPRDRVEANRLFHAFATQGNEDAKRFTGLNKSQPVNSKIMLPCRAQRTLEQHHCVYAAESIASPAHK
jgi:TPR repeat protein